MCYTTVLASSATLASFKLINPRLGVGVGELFKTTETGEETGFFGFVSPSASQRVFFSAHLPNGCVSSPQFIPLQLLIQSVVCEVSLLLSVCPTSVFPAF